MVETINISKRPYQKRLAGFIILLCIISRLPQLTSANLILDGDECVVAMMTKHLYNGQEFPLFFWGQQYGLSLFECLAILPFYAVLGMTTLAVKLAMLSLWTTATVFLYKTFVAINKKNAWLPLVLILMFIMSPAWAVWSMKARGGYLTAFCLHSIGMYLLFGRKWTKEWPLHLWMGVITTMIYQSQPLWLPSLLLFYGYRLLQESSLRSLATFLLSALPLFVAFDVYRQGLPTYYAPGWNTEFTDNLMALLARLPEYMYVSLHGYYYFGSLYASDTYSSIAAISFFAMLCCVVIAGILFLFRKGGSLFKVSVVVMLSSLAPALLTYSIEPRYLLPVTGLGLISLLLLLNETDTRKWMLATCGSFIILGSMAQIAFRNYSFGDTTEDNLRETLHVLDKKGIRYLFSPDDLLTWQVNFYSDEKVICRSTKMPGRYPPYIELVNRAFFNGGKTAVFGYTKSRYQYLFKTRRTVGHYYIVEYPEKEIVKADFEF